MQSIETTATSQPAYAGFWLRAAAFIIDTIIISIPTWLISIPFFIYTFFKLEPVLSQVETADEISPETIGAILTLWGVGLLIQLVWVIFFWLYFALFESGTKQATWGKQIVGIRVTGLDGERISFARATGRAFSKFISYMIFYVGFIMAAFTDKKQALHDIIAGTLVVKN